MRCKWAWVSASIRAIRCSGVSVGCNSGKSATDAFLRCNARRAAESLRPVTGRKLRGCWRRNFMALILVGHHDGDCGLWVVDVERAANGNQFDEAGAAVVVSHVERNGQSS